MNLWKLFGVVLLQFNNFFFTGKNGTNEFEYKPVVLKYIETEEVIENMLLTIL
jgi:hypothetical protein